jgi:hypothetical protein
VAKVTDANRPFVQAAADWGRKKLDDSVLE